MATDGTHVYWTDTESDSLQRAELDEGAAQTVASFPGVFPDGVAVDESSAYVSLAEGSVIKVDKDTGEQVVIASDQDSPAIVAVDDACVYWANTALASGRLGAVMRAPK
jgi:sugar lactone lactonase YvrE